MGLVRFFRPIFSDVCGTNARRTAAAAIALLGISAGGLTSASAPALADNENPKTCTGRNVLADMREKDPVSVEKIMRQAEATKNDGAVLWRITREDKPVSYLFGTIHMTDERVTQLSKAVRTAISKSRVVALEVTDASPAATVQAIGAASDLVLFNDDERLDQLIPAEEFAQVEKELRKARLPAAMAHMFKPWVVSMILAVDPCERKRVAAGVPVVDVAISARAQELKIPVIGLETLQSQLESAAAVPMDEQVQVLRASLVHAGRADDLRETVLSLYLDRKIGAVMPLQLALGAKSGEVSDNLDGFRAELITKRNRRMRTRALPLLAEGGAFIAVGALHLVGQDGLVQLFRDAGYQVEPVE